MSDMHKSNQLIFPLPPTQCKQCFSHHNATGSVLVSLMQLKITDTSLHSNLHDKCFNSVCWEFKSNWCDFKNQTMQPSSDIIKNNRFCKSSKSYYSSKYIQTFFFSPYKLNIISEEIPFQGLAKTFSLTQMKKSSLIINVTSKSLLCVLIICRNLLAAKTCTRTAQFGLLSFRFFYAPLRYQLNSCFKPRHSNAAINGNITLRHTLFRINLLAMGKPNTLPTMH